MATISLRVFWTVSAGIAAESGYSDQAHLARDRGGEAGFALGKAFDSDIHEVKVVRDRVIRPEGREFRSPHVRLHPINLRLFRLEFAPSVEEWAE